MGTSGRRDIRQKFQPEAVKGKQESLRAFEWLVRVSGGMAAAK
jgi:hypothetical protein